MAESNRNRVDEHGRAYKGSQLQAQAYVTCLTRQLNAAIEKGIADVDAQMIRWRAPLPGDRYAEPRDSAFLRLAGLGHLEPALKRFWPRGGPVWDAVATFTPRRSASHGVLLVEAKSYPEEMRSACKASDGARVRIVSALESTIAARGASGTTTWTTAYYQLANRIAWLDWLRDERVDARLVLLSIIGDPHRPTTEAAWRDALETVWNEMGLDEGARDHIAEVFLSATQIRTRDLPVGR